MSSAQAQVEQLLAERVPFAHIEAYIERRRDISEDQRNALWLYAWSRSGISVDIDRCLAVGEARPARSR